MTKLDFADDLLREAGHEISSGEFSPIAASALKIIEAIRYVSAALHEHMKKDVI